MQPSPQPQPNPPEQPGASALQGNAGPSPLGSPLGTGAGLAPGVGRALGASNPFSSPPASSSSSSFGADGVVDMAAAGSELAADGATEVVEASFTAIWHRDLTDTPADPFGEIDESVAGDCQAMIARLYHFLDGELTDARRAKIMRHLEGCPACFSAYDFEAELRIVVRERTRTHVPPSLLGRIRVALESERDGC